MNTNKQMLMLAGGKYGCTNIIINKQILSLVNLEVAMHYAYVFIIKNPAGFHDGFWFTFLTSVIVCFSCLNVMAAELLDTFSTDMLFYFCIGEKPTFLDKQRDSSE